jgi:acetyl-CoA carboxylase biotin carboxyl carrier protein
MNLDEIRQILEMVREHALAEFELEQEGVKLRIRKEGVAHVVASPVAAPAVVPTLPASSPGRPVQAAAGPEGAPDEEGVEFAVVKSPIVGTFYRAPEPTAPAFVEAGQVVRKGQTLCIIEAMKLMNEITSEYDGELVKIYVENGQPVQFGERLFAIRAR